VAGFDGVRLVAVGGEAPEDVLVDGRGRVYTGLSDGRVVRLDADGAPPVTVARVPGRPLGLELLGPDELLVCAADAGLLVVSLDGGAVRTLADRVGDRALLAVNNAAVAADGTVYFSDSSTRFPMPRWRADLIQRTRTGRLFRRTPDGVVTELLGGLEFANGVALAADGSYVAVAETGACRLQRVWLTGARPVAARSSSTASAAIRTTSRSAPTASSGWRCRARAPPCSPRSSGCRLQSVGRSAGFRSGCSHGRSGR
jgi:sugar lactone lactonase YvrE